MRDPKYPRAFFIQGVGFKKKEDKNPIYDMQLADRLSIKNIAEQIQVSISSISIDSQKETTTGSHTTSMSTVEIITQLEVELNELAGFEIAERFFDKSRQIYYSLGVLNKTKASFALSREIEKGKNRALSYFNNGNEFVKKGLITQSFVSYSTALKELHALLPKEKLYISLTGKKNATLQDQISIPRVEKKVINIASHIHLEKVSGNRQQADLNNRLSKDLVLRIYYDDSQNKFPISSLPVHVYFKQNREKVIDDGTTDKKGIITTSVKKVPPDKRGSTSIILQVTFEHFFDNSFLIPKSAEFEYVLTKKSDLKVLVIINEKFNLKKTGTKIVESELMKELTHSDFTLIQPDTLQIKRNELTSLTLEQLKKKLTPICDILLIGIVEVRKKSIYQDIFFAESEGLIKLIDIKEGKIISLYSFFPQSAGGKNSFDTKGAGLNFEVALRNSLSKTARMVANELVKKMNSLGASPRGIKKEINTLYTPQAAEN